MLFLVFLNRVTNQNQYLTIRRVPFIVGYARREGLLYKKLNSIVESVVKEDFERIKSVPKSAVISSRYKEELTIRKANLKHRQSEYAKELEKLNKLRAEVVKSIQGESAFSQTMLAGLVEDSEARIKS